MEILAQALRAPRLASGMTVVEARRALTDAFRRAGLDSPELDARLLTGHALGLDHTGLVIEANRDLRSDEASQLIALAARRLEREPVARILGVKEFWGLPLRITQSTLVPRPETETVVEAALAAIDQGGPRHRTLRIADLGTGSGALLIALLTELPNATGVATDISIDALRAARDNARRLMLQPRAHFVACDFGAALPQGFDLVVSNPPYIMSGDIAGLAPEVRHDPRRALDGGTDGLACYRTIAGQAGRLLKPHGHIVVELGIGQEAPVAALFRAGGLAPTPAHTDLSGVPRALHAAVAK
ncbi:MAG: peptide chain release factor N(5)-glutamine methyltransferase [Xanthobacteraceae bacterium]|nr:peptide chain release factor N(5)-glutamine methyltransferase [Xanthobacteraceae bacterium]